jgi:hypothetical protein
MPFDVLDDLLQALEIFVSISGIQRVVVRTGMIFCTAQ